MGRFFRQVRISLAFVSYTADIIYCLVNNLRKVLFSVSLDIMDSVITAEPCKLTLCVFSGFLLQPLYARCKLTFAFKLRHKLLIAYRLRRRRIIININKLPCLVYKPFGKHYVNTSVYAGVQRFPVIVKLYHTRLIRRRGKP